MSDDQSRNVVDDVDTENTGEEAAEDEHRDAAEHHHGEGFDSEDLAKKGRESKENPPDAE